MHAPSSGPLVGVLALQGDFAEHQAALARVGVKTKEVRVPADLEGVGGLVLPGGESTTMLKLLELQGLTDMLQPMVDEANERVQDPDYKARPMPDLGLLSKQNRPAPPREQFGINRKNITLNSNEQFKTSSTRTSGILNPHLLTPKYSPVSALGGNPEDEKVKAPNENIISLSSIVPQENSQIHSIKQTMENTKNGWIMDAMLEGLDKYKAASRLDPDRSGASRVSVSR